MTWLTGTYLTPFLMRSCSETMLLYSWQGNRNIFIDHPKYVIASWGEECGIEMQVSVVSNGLSLIMLPLAAISLFLMVF